MKSKTKHPAYSYISTAICVMHLFCCLTPTYAQTEIRTQAIQYFNSGNSHSQKGDYQKAVEDYTQAIKLRPGYVEAYYNRAATYSKMYHSDNAIADYTKVIELKPDHVEVYFQRGSEYVRKGYIGRDKAIADFTAYLKLVPDNTDAYLLRADRYAKKDEYDKAIADYTQALKLRPDLVDIYCKRARVHHSNGEFGTTDGYRNGFNKAITDYTHYIKLRPNDADAYHHRGFTYCRIRQYDKAIADYTQAIKIKPDHPVAHFFRAKTYYLRGRAFSDKINYDKIIEDVTKAIKINPNLDMASVYRLRGQAYDNRGDYDKAIADYTKTIETRPDFRFAYIDRSRVYTKQHKHTLADNDLERAESLCEEKRSKICTLADWMISRQRAGFSDEKIDELFQRAWQVDKSLVQQLIDGTLKYISTEKKPVKKYYNVGKYVRLSPQDIETLRKVLAKTALAQDIISREQALKLDPELHIRPKVSVKQKPQTQNTENK